MSHRSRKAGQSSEDLEVWARVAETVTPMSATALTRPSGLRDTTRDTPAPAPPPAAGVDEPKIRPFTIGGKRTPQIPRHDLAVDPSDALHGARPRVDARTHARLKRGKLRPEARIDLHGMTLSQAHPALTGFLSAAHAQGKRVVLVITGKGRDGDDGGVIPARRGVLRHQVPHWCQTPPLSQLVVQITPAHFRHGGDGAYYVYLRRAR